MRTEVNGERRNLLHSFIPHPQSAVVALSERRSSRLSVAPTASTG